MAVAVLSVSFAAPLFRLAEAPALTASFWRLAIATAILLAATMLPGSRAAWAAWRGYGARDWMLVAATGAALAFHFAAWVTSLQWTSVAAATALVTLQAVFVAIGGHLLLRDRLGGLAWVGVGVAVAGCLTITAADGGLAGFAPPAGRDASLALRGDLLALAAGLGSAAYMLVGRRLRATRGLLEYVIPVYAAAAVALLVAMPVLGQPVAQGLGTANFGVFVLLAAVPMLGGHTVSNWCLRYLPAHTVATWILLEPVGAALLAWPLLGEVPSWGVAAGGGLVIAGAALTIPRAPAAAVAPEPAG